MAGRGRGATLPAWMTAGGGADAGLNDQPRAGAPTGGGPAFPYSEQSNGNGSGYPVQKTHQPPQQQQQQQYQQQQYQPPPASAYGSNSFGQNDRYQQSGRGGYDSRRNGGARETDKERRDREAADYVWHPRDKRIRNFDVKPPDGVDLPPIGVVSTPDGVPNSYYSYINPANPPAMPMMPKMKIQPPAQKMDASLQTRHARRLYAGGIPPQATDAEVMEFFNILVTRALGRNAPSSPPVIQVYLNTEKCYAFVEFVTIELATACMQLDGVKFDHRTGTTLLRVRRPNDYKPETLPPPGPLPELDQGVLAAAGATTTAGPGKIFIGGLPYNLTDEQVMELLGAFGPIKHFNQVRDPGSVTSKGYGFCEYANPDHAAAAINGLNGMQLGEKVLNVRIAVPSANTTSSSGVARQQQQQQQLQPSIYGMAGGMNFGVNSFGSNNSAVAGMNMLPAAGMLAGGAGMIPQGNMGGYGNPPAVGAAVGGYNANSAVQAAPTKVLQLSNMVTAQDLADDSEYNDIKEDVRLECLEYGPVVTVLIPRARDGYPLAAEGFIYVQYTALDAAQKASAALNGRKFAENTVIVRYFDEAKFNNGILL